MAGLEIPEWLSQEAAKKRSKDVAAAEESIKNTPRMPLLASAGKGLTLLADATKTTVSGINKLRDAGNLGYRNILYGEGNPTTAQKMGLQDLPQPPSATPPPPTTAATTTNAVKTAPTGLNTDTNPIVQNLDNGMQRVLPSEAMQAQWLAQNKDPRYLAEQKARDDYNTKLMAKNAQDEYNDPQNKLQRLDLQTQEALYNAQIQAAKDSLPGADGLTPAQMRQLRMIKNLSAGSSKTMDDEGNVRQVSEGSQLGGLQSINAGDDVQKYAAAMEQFKQQPAAEQDLRKLFGERSIETTDTDGNKQRVTAPIRLDNGQILGGEIEAQQGKSTRQKQQEAIALYQKMSQDPAATDIERAHAIARLKALGG